MEAENRESRNGVPTPNASRTLFLFLRQPAGSRRRREPAAGRDEAADERQAYPESAPGARVPPRATYWRPPAATPRDSDRAPEARSGRGVPASAARRAPRDGSSDPGSLA